MSGLDAPRLRIEVVGAIADILHGAEGDTFVSDGDEATRGIRWQDESFATQVFQGFGVREVYVERGWRKENCSAADNSFKGDDNLFLSILFPLSTFHSPLFLNTHTNSPSLLVMPGMNR